MATPPEPPWHSFGILKGHRRFFSPDDDQTLRQLKASFPALSWPEIAGHMPGFTPRQVRERWCNYLAPDLKTDDWASDEDAELVRLHTELGPRWGLIGNCMGNRSGPDIKNRYQTIRLRSRKQSKDSAKSEMNQTNSKPVDSAEKKIAVVDDPRPKQKETPPNSTTEFSIKNILAH
jgi:hypothetical protein